MKWIVSLVGGGLSAPDKSYAFGLASQASQTISDLTQMPRYIVWAYKSGTYGVDLFWGDVENEKLYCIYTNNGSYYPTPIEAALSQYITNVSASGFTIKNPQNWQTDNTVYVFY